MTGLPPKIDHAPGDATGLLLPAHGEALAACGKTWLTDAFRAFGALAPDNAVTAMGPLVPCPGGSTGAKFFLDVAYARPGPDLPERLFVKFSRDFADSRRDHPGRFEMASEARFMPLSRLPGFPIAVPRTLFADYHLESGTGIIVTECIGFGENGIEPHRAKCMDHETLADPGEHYRAIVTALARLAAADQAGQLAPDIAARFPFDPVAGSADPIRYDDDGLEAALASCRDFARECPQLLPAELRDEAFMDSLATFARRVRAEEPRIRTFLAGDPRLIALCHWNAHIDNCWFTHDPGGRLTCGLIDWGRVGRLTFGSVLWGGLSAADGAIWAHGLTELLATFVSEYAGHGGPGVSVAELERHLALHMAAMGVARVLAFPKVIRFRCPEAATLSGPRDPVLLAISPARNCLHIYSNWLRFWQARDIAALLDDLPGA